MAPNTVRRRIPRGRGWAAGARRLADMHNLPLEPESRDRGLSRMPHMPSRPWSDEAASSSVLRMIREPRPVPGDDPTPLQVPAVIGWATKHGQGERDHARAARMPRGTGPMDAAAGGPKNP